MLSPLRLAEKYIPNRMNRSLWWLTLGLGYSVVLSGPPVSGVVFQAIYEVPLMMSLLWLWPMNFVSMTVALILGALVLHRTSHALSAAQATLFAVGVTVFGVLVRFVLVQLSGRGPLPSVNTPFILTQFTIGLVLLAALVSAIAFAAFRERAVSQLYAELNRTQISLAQEEEQVRGEVFDHLHGTLQAEFVSMRQELRTVGETTTDPHAAETCARVEARLENAYREGVESITRALYPAGLEAGLGIALAELAYRRMPTTEISITMDPVTSVMDDPMIGGLHRSLRMTSYRIVEEAVSNAIEHSESRSIRVTVTSDLDNGAAALHLQISHDVDAPVMVDEGSGLARMRSRARALGGSVTYGTTDRTFSVRAQLPMVRPDEGRWTHTESGLG